MKQVNVAIGIVVRDGRVLICRRPARAADAFAGLWEFPGGKCADKETPEECLKRELLEEVGLTVHPADSLPAIEHQYPSIHVRLYPYLCQYIGGEAQGIEGQEIRWVAPVELESYEFPAANRELIRGLVERWGKLGKIFL